MTATASDATASDVTAPASAPDATPNRPATPDAPSLTGVLLRLKVQLLENAFRRSPWQTVGLVVALIYGAAAAALGVLLLVVLRLADAVAASGVVVVLGTLIVLGFLLAPLVFGVDDTLDPRRFALIGVRPGRLAGSLAVAALLGIPALALIAVAIAQVVTWARGPAPALLAVLGAVLIVATCVLGSRVAAATAGMLLATRRARDLSGLLAILLIVLGTPAVALLATVDWRTDGMVALGRVATVAGWTPFGAAWAAPAAAATGDPAGAVLHLAIAVVFVAVLAVAWRLLVGLVLVTPQRVARVRDYGGLGWFRRLPATASGGIAARSITYWVRDPRYRISLLIVPVVPFAMFVPLLVAGVPGQVLWLIPTPVAALFLGWFIHNDVSFDNTAIWSHIAAGVRGSADRLGRMLPVLIVGVPLIVLAALGCADLYGGLRLAPALIGVSICLLLCGLGLSSLLSASFPYPSVRPGDSPFQQPQSAGATGSLVQSVSFLAILALTTPALLLGALAVLTRGSGWSWWAFLAGVGTGVVVLVAGTAIGARVFERRGPELLAFAARN